MRISATTNGFAFVAVNPSHDDVKVLKLSRWYQHPSTVFCARQHRAGKVCHACAWRVPELAWYVSSQQCGDPNHPVSQFIRSLDPPALELFHKLGQTSSMSRAESSALFVPAPQGKKYLPFQLAGIEFALQRQHTLIADEPGLGKAQPLDAKVLTPKGWKLMGDIKTGDLVIGADGKPTLVTGVFPQGVKKIFKVVFSDGASTECCDDHLWQVNSSLRRFQGLKPCVKPLSELRQKLTNGRERLHYIPLVKPVEFQSDKLPLDPYLLGCLLGDLFGKKSAHKFIPDLYKLSSAADRLALLQGLLDTDGYSEKNGTHIEFTSTSPQLAKDVQFLVQSLGGLARITPKPAKCLLSHRVSISLPTGVTPFRLTRKAQSQRPRTKYEPTRNIVTVEPVADKECQCISVEASDGLYVTDDFVVTHNTIQAIGFANATRARNMLIICPASLRRNWQRELDRWLVDAKHTKVFVLSYEQAKAELQDLLRSSWDVLVLDEAHYLKNPKAARTKAIFGVDEYSTPKMVMGRMVGGRVHKRGIFETAQRTLALTGTPIANRPKDVWTLVHALAPQAFPNYLEFAKRYCDAKSERVVVKGGGGKMKKVWKFDGQSNLPELGQKLRNSIMIRREKISVLRDLPDKTRQIMPLDVSLTSVATQAAFDKAVNKAIGDKLRQAESRGDFKAFGSLIQQVVPFSEMAKVRKNIGLEKLPAVMAFLDERLCLDREKGHFDSQEKIVVFAHHREVLSTIKDAYGRHAVVFWGGMSDNQRSHAVDEFQNNPDVRVFAGQITASGTGLTLTASSTVVFAELDWVPANLVQCEDRIHRIGQKNSALAIYLVVDGSLEARMAFLLAEKDEIIRQALR